MGRYLPIVLGVARRKPGTLLPLEAEILGAAVETLQTGEQTFYGFSLAQAIREQGGSRSLTGHGTMYKALARLEDRGLLASAWEPAAQAEGRPRRRLYRLTDEGARAGAHALADAAKPRAGRRLPLVSPEPA